MKLSTREIALFGITGALMYATKAAMAFVPNVHLVGVFIVALTVVYRKKALYPLYTYVFLEGLFGGFTTWWLPYLYVWTVLWGVVMLLPKNLPAKAAPFIYMSVCACHGFLFGTLFAPAQALIFGLNLEGTIAWIAAGLPFDAVHGVSNFCCGVLIVPIIKLLRKFETEYN